jgi:alkyl hydroperoxide reductase subunit F
MYDLIIIGGGPGGVAAGIYAARKKIKTLLITESFGGQSIVSADVQNWIGTKSVSGFDLAKMLEDHVRAYEKKEGNDHGSVEIRSPALVSAVREIPHGFEIITDKGEKLETKTIILTSGSRRRKLGVLGEKEFEGKGVAYCSTCDAPLFSGKIVAVVGGGNAGLEAVVDLFPYAEKIYLLEYGEALKGDPVTQERVKNGPKPVEIILNAQTEAILGEKFVNGLRYKDRRAGELEELVLDGVFVEIGATPNSDMVKDLVALNKYGEVVIDSKTGKTSREGIWAAGDVSDDPFKQNNISAGDAVKAALSCYQYLLDKKV